MHIVGDVSDAGRAKTITENLLEDYIANSVNFIDELVANNYFTTELANNTNFINTLTNNAQFQTNVNNFVTGGSGGGSSIGNVAEIFDDFLGQVSATVFPDDTFLGNYSWGVVGGGGPASLSILPGESSHPGILRVLNTDSNGDGIVLGTEVDTAYFDNGFSIEVMVRVPAGSTLASYMFGMSASNGGANFAGNDNKIAIIGGVDGGNAWEGISADGGGATSSASSAAIVADAWIKLKITFDGTTAEFFANDVSLGTVAADIPTGVASVVFLTKNGGGQNGIFHIDYSDVAIRDLSGGGEKKVGVGSPSDINWFNIQLPFSMVNSTDAPGNVWDITGVSTNNPSILDLGSGDFVFIAADQGGFLPDTDNTGGDCQYQFDSNTQAIFQCVVFTAATGGGNVGGVGFCAIGTNGITHQGTNNLDVSFIRSAAGAWFARSGTGAGHTEVPITLTDSTKYVLRIEYDPGNATPQARYYVDGVLVATVTTNVPNAVDTKVGWGAGNDGANDCIEYVTCPSFAVEI